MLADAELLTRNCAELFDFELLSGLLRTALEHSQKLRGEGRIHWELLSGLLRTALEHSQKLRGEGRI